MDDTTSTSQWSARQVFPLSDAASAAESLFAQVLTGCAGQMGLQDADTVVDLLRRGDPVAHHACEQQLARHVAEYLSRLDGGIKAVYRYEWAGGGAHRGAGETEAGPTIHLVVLTRQRTAALISVLAALNRALSQAFADRWGSTAGAHVLNVCVIDDADTRNEASYAALLFPPHLEPIPVWQR